MSRRDAPRALADVTSVMVDGYDVVSAVTGLATACRDVLGAHGVGVLVVAAGELPAGHDRPTAQRLELLAATSHAAAELELSQGQVTDGPTLDAIAADAPLCVIGPEALRARWPRYGPAATALGIRTVWALPLRWRGRAIGALNVFRTDDEELEGTAHDLAMTFANLTTLLIVHGRALPDVGQIAVDLERALDGRIVIERAKGVLMALRGLEAGAAFDELVAGAGRRGHSLAAEALRVLEDASLAPRSDAPHPSRGA